MVRRTQWVSRHRRVLLPVTLWATLAGCVGLAVLVRGALERQLGVELGAAQTVATLRLRLPTGWVTVHDPFPGGNRILAYEDGQEEPQEHLEIYHLPNPSQLTPQELLLLPPPFGIPLAYFDRQGPHRRGQPNPTGALTKGDREIEIAGTKGILRGGYQFTRDRSHAWRDLFAAARLPGDEAIIVKLRTLRPLDALESRREPLLLRRVAESIVVVAPLSAQRSALPEPIDAEPRQYEQWPSE
jgi:hypothetical protein